MRSWYETITDRPIEELRNNTKRTRAQAKGDVETDGLILTK